MLMSVWAILSQVPDGWKVFVPDYPSIEAGEWPTIESAIQNGGDAVSKWMEATMQSGGKFDKPSTFTTLQANDEYKQHAMDGNVVSLTVTVPLSARIQGYK